MIIDHGGSGSGAQLAEKEAVCFFCFGRRSVGSVLDLTLVQLGNAGKSIIKRI